MINITGDIYRCGEVRINGELGYITKVDTRCSHYDSSNPYIDIDIKVKFDCIPRLLVNPSFNYLTSIIKSCSN